MYPPLIKATRQDRDECPPVSSALQATRKLYPFDEISLEDEKDDNGGNHHDQACGHKLVPGWQTTGRGIKWA